MLSAWLNDALSGPPGQATSLALLLVLLPEGVSQAFILGLAQWFVLRRYAKMDYRWIAVSILGWTIFYGLYLAYLSRAGVEQLVGILSDIGAVLLFVVARGLLVGLCQWLVLRPWGAPARLWIPIMIVAQVANLIVSRLLSDLPVAAVMGWIANGLVMGVGMIFLLNACWAELLARGQVAGY